MSMTENSVEAALKARIMESIDIIVEEQLPQVEDAIATTVGTSQAAIAVKVTFKPGDDGDMELVVSGKSTLPATSTDSKVRLVNGRQLTLI